MLQRIEEWVRSSSKISFIKIKKYYVHIIILTISILAFSSLYINKFWPFSTGSEVPAFLGTTFEMSLPEVKRALRKNNARLVDLDTFEQLDSRPNEKHIFISQWLASAMPNHLFADERVERESWYMPSIEMFESQVVAEFSFDDNRLTSVEIRVFPIQSKNAENVAEAMATELVKKYPLIKKEFSKEVPGAYRYVLNGRSMSLDLWINPTDQSKPIIALYINSTEIDPRKAEMLKKRQIAAF